jgi:RNA polymerase sigma-70 factor, ECF subfamily
MAPIHDSTDWLSALRSEDPERRDAIEQLHALLLRASRYELSRRRAALSHVRGEELDDIAMQAADDALVAILRKLDTYRGESRFTTWAYKFALLECAVRLRRRAWQGREVVLDSERWPSFADPAESPHAATERGELLEAVREAMETSLTPRQREVLVALAIDGVPIDVLAERLDTTRGALYKMLHDARRKLRSVLADQGLALEEKTI